MRSPNHQLVLGALCAGQALAAEAAQRPLQGGVGTSKKGESPFTDEYAKHVDRLLERWHVPGMAVGVVDGDDIWTEVRPKFDPVYFRGDLYDTRLPECRGREVRDSGFRVCLSS